MRAIDRATWHEQPWKNGRGTTLEIARWRITRTTEHSLDEWTAVDDDDYDVRVSIAEVTTSGPFSTFPGYLRHTFLVGPAPIQLGDVELVAPGDHVGLPGDRAIEATLAVPTHLLNVLVRSHLPIVVGYGPTSRPVRFVFDVDRRSAFVGEPTVIDLRDAIWLA
ncbi:MAG: HutD family protein [Kofleriaceae bacterium]